MVVQLEEIRLILDGKNAEIGAQQIEQAFRSMASIAQNSSAILEKLGAQIDNTGRKARTGSTGVQAFGSLTRETERSVADLAKRLEQQATAATTSGSALSNAARSAVAPTEALAKSIFRTSDATTRLNTSSNRSRSTLRSLGLSTTAANSTLASMSRATLGAAAAQETLISRIDRQIRSSRRLSDAATRGARDARRFGEEWRNAGSRVERASRTTGLLERQIGKLAAFFTAGLIVRGLVGMSDSFDSLQNRLRLVTDGTADLIERQTQLGNISADTRSNIRVNADLYNRLFRSTRELGTGTEDLLIVTSTLNKAIKLSGATSAEAQAGLIQLAQGLASGALRGDELRSVLEQIPIVADAIQQRLGVTRGELRALGEDGKLTSEIIIDSVLAIAPRIDEQFKKVTPLIGDSLANIASQATRVLGNVTVGGVSLAEIFDRIALDLDRIGTAQEAVAAREARSREATSLDSFIEREREIARILEGGEAQISEAERRRKAEEQERLRQAEALKKLQEEIGESAADEVKQRREAANLIRQNIQQLESLQGLLDRPALRGTDIIEANEPGRVVPVAKPFFGLLGDEPSSNFIPDDRSGGGRGSFPVSLREDPFFGPVSDVQVPTDETVSGRLVRTGIAAAGIKGRTTVEELGDETEKALDALRAQLAEVEVGTKIFIRDAEVDEQSRQRVLALVREVFDSPIEDATDIATDIASNGLAGIGVALDALAPKVDDVKLGSVLTGIADTARDAAKAVRDFTPGDAIEIATNLFKSLEERAKSFAQAERQRVRDQERSTSNAEKFVRQLETQLALLGAQDDEQRRVTESMSKLFELTKDGDGVYESFAGRVADLTQKLLEAGNARRDLQEDEQGRERLDEFIARLEQEVEVLRFDTDLQRELAQARLDAGLALGLTNDELIAAIQGQDIENDVLREKIELINSLVNQRERLGQRTGSNGNTGSGGTDGLVDDADKLGRDIAGAVTSRLDNIITEAETLRDALQNIWKDIANDLLNAFILDPIKQQFADLFSSIFAGSPANQSQNGTATGQQLARVFSASASNASAPGSGFGGVDFAGGEVGPVLPPLEGPPPPPIGGGGASFFQQTGVVQGLAGDDDFVGPPAPPGLGGNQAAGASFNPLLFGLGGVFGALLSQAFPLFGAAKGGFLVGSGQQGFAAMPGVPGGGIQTFARGGSTLPSFVDRPTMFPLGDGFGMVGEKPSSVGEVIMPAFRTQQGDIGVRVEGVENLQGPTTIQNTYVFPNVTDHGEFRRSERASNDDLRRGLNRR